MTLKALIFDVDGTLADTEELHRESFNAAFFESGLEWRWNQSQYRDLLQTTGGKERMAAYVRSLTLSECERDECLARIPALHRVKTEIYSHKVKSGHLALREGVARLFDEAETSNIRIAVATTTTFDNVAVLMESAFGRSALDRLAVIGAGDQVKSKKPAPDVYEWVLQQLAVSPDHCVAFEDSANGLAAAKAAALFTVVTPCFWTENQDFSAADMLLSTLGSANAPLSDTEAARLGARWLGISQLQHALRNRSRS